MKTKKSTRFVAVLGALALVLAACGDGDGGGDAPEEGALGSVTVAEGDAIQIRSLNVISGPNAVLGVPNERAVAIAIEDYGPIKGFEVDMGTGLDDLCSGEGGQAAAQTIVSDEQVVGVIGTSCSGAAVAASPLISDAGMVMISPSNTSPALTSDLAGNAGSDYHEGYYRTAHNDLFQGQAVANFVTEELGLTTAAAIHDGDSYTQGLAQAFVDAFEELGGTAEIFAVNKEDTDMTPVLTEVATVEPEMIYFPIFQPAGDFIVQQVGQVAGLEDVVLFGADGLFNSDFLGLPETEGMYFSGPNLNFGENVNEHTDVSVDDFLTNYEEQHGEPPTAPFWAHSYDATTMLLAAIEEVSVETDDGLFIDREALREALTASAFSGMIGELACDDFGDCGAQEIQINLHEDSSVTDTSAVPVVYTFKGEVG